MSLEVEDGTGLPDAESYQSVAELKAYWDAHGLSYAGKTNTEIEQAARRGTKYLDANYYERLPGNRVNGRDQALEWPRENVVDDDGVDLPSDELPVELLSAHSEATHRELVSPGSLTPDYVETERVVSEQVGPLQVTYSDQGTESNRPQVPMIDEIMRPILLAGPGLNSAWLMRA